MAMTREERDYVDHIAHEHNILQAYVCRLEEAFRVINRDPLWRWYMWVRPLTLPRSERRRVIIEYSDRIVPMEAMEKVSNQEIDRLQREASRTGRNCT